MKAENLFATLTLNQLSELESSLRNNPANRTTGLFLYNKSTRSKLDAIAWAITWHIREKRIAAGETINDAGYTGKNKR